LVIIHFGYRMVDNCGCREIQTEFYALEDYLDVIVRLSHTDFIVRNNWLLSVHK
jgi:hypothetical protein